MEKIEGEDYDILLLQVKKQLIPTLKEEGGQEKGRYRNGLRLSPSGNLS